MRPAVFAAALAASSSACAVEQAVELSYGLTYLDSATRGSLPIATRNTCEGGLRHDDGSYEGAVGWANAVQKGAYGMAFELTPEFGLERVCICWTRGPFNNSESIDFQVKFHADDGLGPEQAPGYPGTVLGAVTARAENVPQFDIDGMGMYAVPLPEFARSLSGRVHVAVLWQPFLFRQFFLCNDAEETGSQLREVHEGYGWSDPSSQWFPVSPMRPTYRAMGTVLYGNAIFDAGFEDALLFNGFECGSSYPGCD